MSFILDALKKSENARQRQIGPAMAEMPRRRRQSERPVWAFVVAGLLLVNIGVLGLVLSRKKGDVQPVSAVAAAPMVGNAAMQQQQLPPSSPTMLPARQPIQMEPEPLPAEVPNRNFSGNSSLAAESGTPNDLLGDTNAGVDPALQAQVQAALAQDVQQQQPIQAPAVAPLANNPQFARNPPPAAAPAASRSGEVLPTIDELQASGRSFPPMKLDIHSFADKPADRFVFVNMRRYNEGMTLQEGPAVERITEEGVVLNQQGLRFLLPRP